MQKLSLAISNFNERVKIMNQTGSRQLALTAEEARNLHADIFALLANIAESQGLPVQMPAEPVSFDGGSF